jgi:hypothetical protein
MAVKDVYTDSQGTTFKVIEKPGTTLRLEYLFNGPGVLTTGRYGTGYRGPMMLCKTSPTIDQCFGPKPGQWELELGYPTVAVMDGIRISSGSIYIGDGEPRKITTLLGKATSSITARSGTTPGSGTFEIWGNLAGTLTDLGFSDITIKSDRATTVASGEYIQVNFIEGEWWLSGSAGNGSRRFKCLLNGALAKADANATIDTVTAIDGGSAPSPTSAANFLRWAGANNDPAFIVEDWSSGTVAYILESVAWDLITPVENVFTAATNLLKQTKHEIIGKANAATADSTIDTGTTC